MKNGHVVNKRHNSYLGCEVPTPFFLRFQAFCEFQGIHRRALIAKSIEDAILKFEQKLDARKGAAYDALLEAKAFQNGISVNLLKEELDIKRMPAGRPNVTKNPKWPVKPKGAKK